MRPHTSTPNGISAADYARLVGGVYRSHDGLLIALVEPTDQGLRQAYADGAWLVLIERDKMRLVQRAGRLRQPHVGYLIEDAQYDVPELTSWHRTLRGDYAGRGHGYTYDNDALPDLSEIAEALDAAWTRRAEAAIAELARRHGEDVLTTSDRLPVWMRRGWSPRPEQTLLERLAQDGFPV